MTKPPKAAPTVPPQFRAALKAAGLPIPEAEVAFAPGRKFRWDYAWVPQKVALEQQGGIWVRGAHGRGTGIVRDIEKFSLGAALGWRLLLVEPKDLCSAHNLNMIRMALEAA